MRITSYHQANVEDTFDAIVIGSGIGGLTAASLLARHAGQRVLVLERHYTPGGFTHVFHRPGYQWDVGVHYIGQVNDPASPIRATFDHLTDGRLQWHAMPDIYDRVILGGREYEFLSGTERLRDRLKEYFPSEGPAIDGYFRAVRSCARSTGLFFAAKAVPGPIERVAGPLMRAPFLRHARRTTAETLAGLGCSRELAGVLAAQWGNYGLPPGRSSFGMHAIVAAHYFNGAAYPVGGAGAILETMLPAIEAAGGKLLVSADVKEVLLDNHGRTIGVRMQDGREFRAATVISDAGAANTYRHLLPQLGRETQDVMQKIDRIPPSMAHISLYVGLKSTSEELGISPANLWICPGADHDANVSKSEASCNEPLPVVFISFPSAKDPAFSSRYPGRATIEVVAPAPFAWFEKWAETRWKHRGVEYDQLKADLADRLKSELENAVPQVRGKIDYCELSTPLSTLAFTNYQRGEIYGLAHVPERFRLKCLGPRTPVLGLYLTGADVTTAGVTGAMMGGVVSASAILRRNLMSVVTKGISPNGMHRVDKRLSALMDTSRRASCDCPCTEDIR
ncbi:MAG TPA: NAD(P)/FAD-dependent oxidoreductase [Bryobacteraceae bacterium]|nr:NAD(P)/FAD-dependent oxidoreductase [Bryobacteraceae bacterium]